MDLSNIEKGNILKLLQKASSNSEYELECLIANINNDYLNKTDFEKVIGRFKGKQKYLRTTSNIVLNINLSNDKSFSNYNSKISRVTLPGKSIINLYNATHKLNNILDNVVFEKKYFDRNKSRREDNRVINNDYNIKFNLKLEENIDKNSESVSDLLKNWSNISKYFRLKQTISFYHEDNDFRIDVSAVSQSSSNSNKTDYNDRDLLKEVINNKNVIYEVEVEYIGNKKEGTNNLLNNNLSTLNSEQKKILLAQQEKLLDTYLNIISDILRAKQQSLFIISNQEREKTLEKIREKLKKKKLKT